MYIRYALCLIAREYVVHGRHGVELFFFNNFESNAKMGGA